MSKRLFVGGLSWGTTDESLRSAFERFGEVLEAKVIVDRETGRSRGFGFVTFADPQAAQAAAKEMNGAVLDSRVINVGEAHERNPGRARHNAPNGSKQGLAGGGRAQREAQAGPSRSFNRSLESAEAHGLPVETEEGSEEKEEPKAHSRKKQRKSSKRKLRVGWRRIREEEERREKEWSSARYGSGRWWNDEEE
ncbi:MAG: RNA-binding protein [Sandaracinaceae bacterium]|nr:RNA-binding protein [Sandaracinaceae bacterium]MDW8246348.1 RNA-binding protein [Sandaracinaceae bacterium]